MLEPQTNWYVLMGDQKYGPYDYKTIIEMLQSNQLMDYNYVWAPHLEAWTQIHQLEEFSSDRFKLLLQKDSDFLAAFVKRTNPRTETQLPVIGHNNIRFFDGTLISISEAGGLCLLNTPLIQLGDQLKIHVKPKDQSGPSFNVECEVIRKNFSKQRLNAKSGLYYAVRFLDIQPTGLSAIQKWVSGKSA
jgi:PilZ domain/GYF domain 2